MPNKKIDLSPSLKLYKVVVGCINITEEGNFDGEATFEYYKVVAKEVGAAMAKVKLKDKIDIKFFIHEVVLIDFIDKL